MSPCIALTVKLASLILLVNHSTFFLLLQKMTLIYLNYTAYVIVSVSYKSHKVSNFHSSFSTATKNYLIPSKVSSSLLTKIFIGSDINLVVISKTS